MIVDTHIHIVSGDQERYPLSPAGRPLSWFETNPVDAEEMVRLMDEADVAKATLVQALSSHGFDNRYVADSAAAHPDRFASVCIIDMSAPTPHESLRHWIVDKGMHGLRIYTYFGPDTSWVDNPSTHPVWELAEANGFPITILCHTEHFPKFKNVFRKFPKVPVVIEHLAHAHTEGGHPAKELTALAIFPNIHLKYSTINLYEVGESTETHQVLIGSLVDSFGADRLLWGSNFPATNDRPYGELVDLGRESVAGLSKSDQDLVLGGNAVRLWSSLG